MREKKKGIHLDVETFTHLQVIAQALFEAKSDVDKYQRPSVAWLIKQISSELSVALVVDGQGLQFLPTVIYNEVAVENEKLWDIIDNKQDLIDTLQEQNTILQEQLYHAQTSLQQYRGERHKDDVHIRRQESLIETLQQQVNGSTTL